MSTRVTQQVAGLAQQSPEQRYSLRTGARRGVAILSWAHLAVVLLVLILLRTAGDRWWLATVMLFAPRWPYGLPLVALVPAALGLNRRALWPLTGVVVLLVGPVMGLCLPWAAAGPTTGPRLRIMTCNVQGGDAVKDRLAELVLAEQPDVVALQEVWGNDAEVRWPAGWSVLRQGELVIASRFPLHDPQSPNPPNSTSMQIQAVRCQVETPAGPIGVCCLHQLSPRDGLGPILDRHTIINPRRASALREVIDQRRVEAERLSHWTRQFKGSNLVCGDFNMPVDSTIYRANWGGSVNAFSVAGFGFGYTKLKEKAVWQYGVRIDHVLFDRQQFRCERCWVGSDVGSDHLPVLADVDLIE